MTNVSCGEPKSLRDKRFVQDVRSDIDDIHESDYPESTAERVSVRWRKVLTQRGLGAPCHRGRHDLEGTYAMVEWYIGEMVLAIEAKNWQAVAIGVIYKDVYAPESLG